MVEWISVSDRLPVQGSRALMLLREQYPGEFNSRPEAYLRHKIVFGDFWDQYLFGKEEDGFLSSESPVSHWLEIPHPPRPE